MLGLGVLAEVDGDDVGRAHDGTLARTQALALFGMMNWIYTWYRPEEGGIETISRTMTDLFLRGYLVAAASRR